MVLVFWQGIISIHQKSFLEALTKQSSVSKVILVVEQEISPYRKNMGWEVPIINGVEIIISPSKDRICQIFQEYSDAVHVMGGVRIGKMMTLAYNECVKQKGRMGSLSESYDKSGLKGKLRQLKYLYYRLRYYRHVDFFLAVGKEGVKTYSAWGFDIGKVFPWAYFVSVNLPDVKETQEDGSQKIIYAGRLERGKGIMPFVNQIATISSHKYTLDIYGSGPEEEELKKFVTDKKLDHKIRFYPFLNYNDLIAKYCYYDWVALPSTRKDGWGVIISEGLLNGLKGICSDICGVSWAIKNNFNGVVFDWNKEHSCKDAINEIFDNANFANKVTIKKWANNAISAEAGAAYYLKIIDCVYNGKSKPEIPWENK